MSRLTRASVVVVGLVVAVAVFRPTSVETQGAITTNQRIATLETQVATLKSQVTALLAADTTQQGNITAEAAARETADTGLQAQINNVPIVPQDLLDVANYVSVDLNTINDLVGPHVIFSGANVHIQNGNGFTQSKNGPGIYCRLQRIQCEWSTRPRDGSHNFAVVTHHSYSWDGGLVAGSQPLHQWSFRLGQRRQASTAHSGARGLGERRRAQHSQQHQCLGKRRLPQRSNAASMHSLVAVSSNTASGETSTVSGGKNNTASGHCNRRSAVELSNVASDHEFARAVAEQTTGRCATRRPVSQLRSNYSIVKDRLRVSSVDGATVLTSDKSQNANTANSFCQNATPGGRHFGTRPVTTLKDVAQR